MLRDQGNPPYDSVLHVEKLLLFTYMDIGMKLFSHVMEMNKICHNVLNLIIIYELVMKVQTILLEYAIIEFKKVSFWT